MKSMMNTLIRKKRLFMMQILRRKNNLANSTELNPYLFTNWH